MSQDDYGLIQDSLRTLPTATGLAPIGPSAHISSLPPVPFLSCLSICSRPAPAYLGAWLIAYVFDIHFPLSIRLMLWLEVLRLLISARSQSPICQVPASPWASLALFGPSASLSLEATPSLSGGGAKMRRGPPYLATSVRAKNEESPGVPWDSQGQCRLRTDQHLQSGSIATRPGRDPTSTTPVGENPETGA